MLKTKKLQVRLQNYLRISKETQNPNSPLHAEPKASEAMTIQRQEFQVPDDLTDIVGDEDEFHDYNDSFRNLDIDVSNALDSQVPENDPLENYGRYKLKTHTLIMDDGDDALNGTISKASGQITRLHINSKTGVIDIDMSPSPSPSGKRPEISTSKRTSSPSSRLQQLSKSLAAEMEQSILISSEINRSLKE
mmetsp:Transcript_15238/g.17975  ORF Transcript_15238/g.17975 Transcript_15238/m.17975 type:complete len:192 (-) Transcript_15238:1348-1923(-)